ncbi:MAG TPA: SEL1-like repeat protein [Oscillospiraceae bacterium]|nr:SEL1-like repeat protein [Oscillospiraceae bacterium]HNW04627.1 SEL1-like repeat protein [Oscillospiraceae bacterium]
MSKPKKLRRLVKAAHMGKPAAMYRLGLDYGRGGHFDRDEELAENWILLAAEFDFTPAKAWLEERGAAKTGAEK